MKKKILFGVLGVLIIVLGILIVWQRNNIHAVQMAMTMDRESIEQKLEENEQTLKQTMQQYHLQDYAFSTEEIAALANGDMTSEEAIAKLTSGTSDSNLDDPSSPSTSQPSNANPEPDSSATAQDQIQQQVAKMYVLQATFEGKLEQIVQQAIAEYSANAGEVSKQEIVSKHLDEISSLENECDAQVNTVIATLKPLLKETGQNNDLINKIQQTYSNEKSLKKAYYMNQLKG